MTYPIYVVMGGHSYEGWDPPIAAFGTKEEAETFASGIKLNEEPGYYDFVRVHEVEMESGEESP